MISITYFLPPIQSVALGVVAYLRPLYLNRARGLDWVESTWTMLAIFAWSISSPTGSS